MTFSSNTRLNSSCPMPWSWLLPLSMPLLRGHNHTQLQCKSDQRWLRVKNNPCLVQAFCCSFLNLRLVPSSSPWSSSVGKMCQSKGRGGGETSIQKLDMPHRLRSPFYPSGDSRKVALPSSVSCCSRRSQAVVPPASSVGARRPCRQRFAEEGCSSRGLSAV